MSLEERSFKRSLVYSQWHRPKSFSRFMSLEDAKRLTMIDLDSILYVECNGFVPVALIEDARNVGQSKCALITQNLARMSNLWAAKVLWTPSEKMNPEAPGFQDIDHFHVELLHPKRKMYEMSPKEWALFLLDLRSEAAANAFRNRRIDALETAIAELSLREQRDLKFRLCRRLKIW